MLKEINLTPKNKLKGGDLVPVSVDEDSVDLYELVKD